IGKTFIKSQNFSTLLGKIDNLDKIETRYFFKVGSDFRTKNENDCRTMAKNKSKKSDFNM
ncbi:hypothetical protein COBT_003628, partial [Conglomerata obtusa]